MPDKEVTYKYPSTLSILGIVFIVLKLTGVINWSWWWVTAPFWIPIALVIIVLLITGLILIIKSCIRR